MACHPSANMRPRSDPKSWPSCAIASAKPTSSTPTWLSGGFLGLDNTGAFDRSYLPAGKQLAQSDATAWMFLYCLFDAQLEVGVAASTGLPSSSPKWPRRSTMRSTHPIGIGASHWAIRKSITAAVSCSVSPDPATLDRTPM